MIYSEASWFDGYAFAHIAAWQDHKARERKRLAAIQHKMASRKRYTSDNPVQEMQATIARVFSCA